MLQVVHKCLRLVSLDKVMTNKAGRKMRLFVLIGMMIAPILGIGAEEAVLANKPEVAAKKEIKVPMDVELVCAFGGVACKDGKVTLGELVKDKKGVLIDLWAPW